MLAYLARFIEAERLGYTEGAVPIKAGGAQVSRRSSCRNGAMPCVISGWNC